MFLSKDRRKFVRAVGILIILQGLAWFSLAVAGIIVKRSPPDSLASGEITSYSSYLSRIIYEEFMIDSIVRLPENRVIRPQDFEAFLWIYAVLSAVWVAASLDQNLAIRYKKSRQSYSTLVLGVAVLLTSVIDLVYVSLLARDFATCPFLISSDPTTTIDPTTSTTTATPTTTITTTTTPTTTTAATTTPTTVSSLSDPEALRILLYSIPASISIDCQVANGIVMSLAARGYVLWLINVVLGICLLNIGAQAFRAPTLMTYGNNTIPRIKVPELRKAPSPSNDMAFFGDNNAFAPPAPPMGGDGRNRNSTPVALNNKNQSIYY